tara:strand:- start:3594 stop:4277 length:684 start_codon:yes stop_codon:yes gene_type:complete
MAYNHDKGTCWYNETTCCYIGVPKTASTTMRRVFSLDDVDNYLEPENTSIKKLDLITIFRNPLDRLISAYNEVVKRGGHPIEGEGIRKVSFWGLPENKDRFIAFLDDVEKKFFDSHVEEQMFYMTDKNEKLLPFTHILDFDNLDDQFINILGLRTTENPDYFLKHDGMVQIRVHQRSSEEDKKRTKNYLDDKIIERIKKIYSRDFDFWDSLTNSKPQTKLFNSSLKW